MVRPMPAPRKNPPKTEINNLSLVTTGYGTVATATANREIAAALFRLNILPIWCQANMMKGRLIIMIRNAKGNFVFSWINNEIPVTPPSIKSFGIKNPFNSKPAEVRREGWTEHHGQYARRFVFPASLFSQTCTGLKSVYPFCPESFEFGAVWYLRIAGSWIFQR